MTSSTRRAAVLTFTAAAALVATSTPATTAATGDAGGAASAGRFHKIADMRGPRGLDVDSGGTLVVARANGSYGEVVRSGPDRGSFLRYGRVPRGFLAPALDVSSRGEVFVLTTGGPRDAEGAGTLYRWTREDGQQKHADIQAYQRRDLDPYDLEDKPRESNPYGVAALDDGTALVADAAGNDLLRVGPDGSIETVARVKPRTVRVPKGMGEDGPPAGTPMPSEAVVTSVTVGSDGYYYIGELRGFPARPRTSQIWRIRPGARDAVCDPERPYRGACKRYVVNLTSVVALDSGAGGALYAVELATNGWLRAESGDPADAIGRVIRIGHDRTVRTEFGKGRLMMPGDVAVGPKGNVFVTAPIFGIGSVIRIR